MSKKEMAGWGGPWIFFRELCRSWFHRSPGLVGFWLLMVLKYTPIELTKVFVGVAVPVLLAEYVRLRLDRWRVVLAVEPEKKKEYLSALDQFFNTEVNKLTLGKRTLDLVLRIAQYLNNVWGPKFLSRPSERYTYTAMSKSVAGFAFAWSLTWYLPHWIPGMVCLYFAFVDTSAKWGLHLPIKKIGWKNTGNKSWGGLFFGWSAGTVCLLLVFITNTHWYPLLPTGITFAHFLAVTTLGVVTASIAELFGGKWDNFWIPATSAFIMMQAHLILS